MSQRKLSPAAYSGTQKLLHWLIALMVLIMLPVGVYMVYRGGATNFDAMTNTLYTAHKSFGFLILLLVIWRVVLRVTRGAPAPVSTLTPIEVFASETVHKLIYVLIVLVPLFGWAYVSAFPATGVFFGLNLPSILPVNKGLAETFGMLHKFSAYALAGLLMMHMGAAMMHFLIKKDGVMNRMLP
jgi:cytochrome b561